MKTTVRILSFGSAVLLAAINVSVAAPKSSPVEVSARALLEAYENNEAAADSKYKRKVLTVTDGVVARVAATENGRAIVFLGPGRGAQSRTIILCTLGRKDLKRAETLSSGQVIGVKGKCLGLAIMDELRTVPIADCSLQSE